MSEETRRSLSATSNLGINLGCGLTAGAAAAVLSQPADTLLSQINKGKGGPGGAMSKLFNLAREAGPVGLFSGLGAPLHPVQHQEVYMLTLTRRPKNCHDRWSGRWTIFALRSHQGCMWSTAGSRDSQEGRSIRTVLSTGKKDLFKAKLFHLSSIQHTVHLHYQTQHYGQLWFEDDCGFASVKRTLRGQ